MEAAPAGYEGGIGGKFRRRPFRRSASTPYDRPPPAARAPRGLPLESGGGRWISKLVDPASRFIAGSASRLFSSVFRKRLLPPPVEAPEEEHQPRQEVPEVVCNNPSAELQGGERDGDNPTNNSETGGISELEQLLKQKTFTRVEFERLAELLYSRTVEPVTLEPDISYEKKGKTSISGTEIGTRSSKFHGDSYTPVGSLAVRNQVVRDDVASPAELAKAYMGSRPANVSPSVVSLRGQILQDGINLPSDVPSTSKVLDFSVGPRSVIRFSGIPEVPEGGYRTPRPRGRSAIYRMSRSPYFKASPAADVKGGEHTRNGFIGPSSSQWSPVMHSEAKQVLKRRSSVLDSDFGSFGPVRRIRHKSNLMSPLRDARPLLSGKIVPSASTPLQKTLTSGSTLNQRPLLLGERKFESAALHGGNGANRTDNAGSTLVPSQSSETAQKILQQLDKLLPSPKEKSSELKNLVRDESSSKLTPDMLHGRALRSLEHIDSSKILNMQGTSSDPTIPIAKASLPEKRDKVEENGPLKQAVGVNLSYTANSMADTATTTTDDNLELRPANIVAGSAELLPQRKPSFQMSAPEDSLELDDDSYSIRDASSLLPTEIDKLQSRMLEHKTVIADTVTLERPIAPSSQILPNSSSISFKETDKVSVRPIVSEKETGFTFPVAPAPSTRLQAPPTPTMPAPLLEKTVLQKEQVSTSVFSFGTRSDTTSISSSSTVCPSIPAHVSDGSSLNVGVVSDSGVKPADSGTTTTSAEGSVLGNGGETQTARGISFGDAVSSASTSPVVFAFSSSATPSLSNGSLESPSSSFSISATPSLVSTIFPKSTINATSSSSPISTPVPTFSTVSSVQSGSVTSTAPSVSSSPWEKSNLTDLDAKPVKAVPFDTVKASIFNMPSSAAQATSLLFPSFGSSSSSNVNGSMTPISSNSPLALATPASQSSTGSSSSATATFLFSGMSSTGSSLASSSAFASAGSSIFGFGASTQSSSLSQFVSSSSVNSTPATATATATATTTATFGATGGLSFGTQSTQSGNGLFQFSQNSASQFGNTSSSPAFGSSGSPSSGFGISSFGLAASGSNPFNSTSGLPFSDGAGSGSSGSSTSSSMMPVASGFSSSSQTPTSSFFGSTSTLFPSTGLPFGQSGSNSGSSPFKFGSGQGSVFPFTSAGAISSSTTSTVQPVFGGSPAPGFTSGSPGNDQMNVEDSMADDTNQPISPAVSPFGQQANSLVTPNYIFGPPAGPPTLPSSPFQFGNQQNPSVPQTPSAFAPAGNLELPPGGGFSLGSGGGDKSSRRIIKPKRDRSRKK